MKDLDFAKKITIFLKMLQVTNYSKLNYEISAKGGDRNVREDNGEDEEFSNK